MAFWAYILRCADGRYYTGHTDALDRRIAEHQTGGFCLFTSQRLPVELVWAQGFPTRIEALEAERRIKPWSRAKKDALIRQDWTALKFFSRPPGERSTLPSLPPCPSTSLGTNGEGDGPRGDSDRPSPNPSRSAGGE
ncbi:GIY-YIG nuclease family protein [Sphingomonas sanxanigenens]|uniref:GIY-YIG domain-containing protein n=1 Tax=Sphingomonas sanxanigenens DSM 19645 = NX02 TaxID=1123269 RepID=W0A653_9SPHN|nr:GIY-YIG nuclease family protein [Sphingomonas sanxanigenens]AHE51818.1 hypothetical protein NX02_00245 [Sphingomonas sanxanigenens DSM 19645 = NX02]